MTDADLPPAIRRISAVLPGWRTARPPLRVLLVLHSVTAATRIADLAPLFEDPRLQLFCTQTSDAMFPDGVPNFITTQQIRHLTWEQATTLKFHAAITASLGDNLHEIKSHILRIPHGNGYNKNWTSGPADQRTSGPADQRTSGPADGCSGSQRKRSLMPAG
ncbi:hypothetical protein GCM10027589_12780 [Actinocorallia lasiicapitis]